MIHKQKGKIIWQMYMIDLSISVIWPNGFVCLLQSTLCCCCCCCCWQVLYKYLFLLSPGFYLFQRVSPISAREAISLNRWRNGRRYISTSVHPSFCFFPWHLCSCVPLQEYNLKYVDMIEEQLNEALTTYRKPVNGDNYVRRSNQRWPTLLTVLLTVFETQIQNTKQI